MTEVGFWGGGGVEERQPCSSFLVQLNALPWVWSAKVTSSFFFSRHANWTAFLNLVVEAKIAEFEAKFSQLHGGKTQFHPIA